MHGQNILKYGNSLILIKCCLVKFLFTKYAELFDNLKVINNGYFPLCTVERGKFLYEIKAT